MSTLDANLKKHTPDATLCVNLWCCLNQMLLAHGNWRIAIASKKPIMNCAKSRKDNDSDSNSKLFVVEPQIHTHFSLQLCNLKTSLPPWRHGIPIPCSLWPSGATWRGASSPSRPTRSTRSAPHKNYQLLVPCVVFARQMFSQERVLQAQSFHTLAALCFRHCNNSFSGHSKNPLAAPTSTHDTRVAAICLCGQNPYCCRTCLAIKQWN